MMQGKIGRVMGVLQALGLTALLGLWAQAAGAGVIGSGSYSEAGDRSGYAGEAVSLTIHESDLQGLNSALLSFSFDSNLLSFTGVGRDCNDLALPDNCSTWYQVDDVGGVATYSLLATTNPLDFTGAADLFTLLFEIKLTAAPGETVVSFTNFFDTAYLQDPANALDVAGLYDRQSLTGTITVLNANTNGALPIVGSQALALTALALLGLVSRRGLSGLGGRTGTARATPQIPG